MAKKADLILFRTSADAHAQAESARKTAWFAWANSVLQRLGYTAKIAQAMSLDVLNKITFDPEDIEVIAAINDALRTPRAEHFVGMKSKTLQRLLKKQFDDQKKSRQKELLAARMSRQAGASSQQ